jgi:phospholipid/cholesterol/gamma-HCH transport system permease protein
MNAIINILLLIKSFLLEIGELAFLQVGFQRIFQAAFEFKEFLRQCFYMGNRSLLLVAVTGFIIGFLFTLQSRPTLLEFGAVSWMPSMVSISIIREIGPIITV